MSGAGRLRATLGSRRARRHSDVAANERRPAGGRLLETRAVVERPVLGGADDEFDTIGPASEQAEDVALAVADRDDLGRTGQRIRRGLGAREPAPTLLVLGRALVMVAGPLRIARPDLGSSDADHRPRVGLDDDLRMDEEAGAHAVTAGAEPFAAARTSGEVDLGRVLRDDDPPPLGRLGGARDRWGQDRRGIDVVVAEIAVDRRLPRAVAADRFQHQRVRLDDPVDEPCPAIVEPDVGHEPPPACCDEAFNHASLSAHPSHNATRVNPPHSHPAPSAKQMCERGSPLDGGRAGDGGVSQRNSTPPTPALPRVVA